MAKLSIDQIKSVLATYVAQNKIAVDTFTVTRENIVGLLDKIGKIQTIDHNYNDKLGFFDGEDLPFGKTVEEWEQDLILPTDFDETGSTTMAPNDPTYRPVSYSFTLGRKKFKTTERYNNVERAVNNETQFLSIVGMIMKRLYDSEAVFRYQLKKQGLATLIAKCNAVHNASTVFATSTEYQVGKALKESANSEIRGIVVKKISASNTSSWSDLVSNGFIIVEDLITTIDKPTDTTTGEAFLKQLKKDVEIASDISEGHSLNGNTLGTSQSGMVLLVKQGVMPSIEIDTLAGAFHENRLTSPVEIVVINDFGNDASGAFAVLMEKRGMACHNSYRAVREQSNADGDFINYVLHTENTLHISNNTFVKVYKSA